MRSQRIGQWALMGLFLYVLTVELYMLSSRVLSLSTGWFPLLLVLLGAVTVLFGPGRDAAFVLALLLASLSVLWSSIIPEELLIVQGWPGQVARVLWAGLQWIFPFVFVHFSLVFPVKGNWVERTPKRLVNLYVPYAIVLVASILEPADYVTGSLLLVLVLPLGFFSGLAIFVRQYLYQLSSAERNRLLLVLGGCLAGGLPRLLSILAGEYSPPFAEETTRFLLPIFPLCLSIAVLKENLSQLPRTIHTLLVALLVLAGVLVGTFPLNFLLTILFQQPGSTSALLLSSVAALLIAYPLSRWASAFVARRFAFSASKAAEGPLPSQFAPIQPNPFVVGNPIRSPEMFFGRTAEFRFVETRLKNRAQGMVIVLSGERRTGKSSILYQILNGRLGKGYLPVFLDMQAQVVQNDAEFLTALSSKLEDAAQDHWPEPGTGAMGSPYASLSGQVSLFLSQAVKLDLLLLIDEYELIDERIGAGKLSRELPNFLNSLLEANPRFSLILTGSQPLQAKPVWSSLLGKSVYREISFLEQSDAEDLLRVPLKGLAVFRVGVLEEVLRLTNAHPFFTQLIGQTLVDALNERKSFTVDEAVLKEVVERVVDNPPPQLLYHWAGLSSGEQLILAGLAEALRTGRDFASFEKVQRSLRSIPVEYRREIEGTETRIVLESLRRKKVLDRDQIRYRFTMDLVRLWVRQEQSIWNVLGQMRHA